MAKIWGIAPWQGKVIDGSDTRTVMDQYNADEAAKPKSTEYKNTEEPLGPPSIAGGLISLDPVDYIGPGALAKAGAAIKGALTGGAMLVGAMGSKPFLAKNPDFAGSIMKDAEGNLLELYHGTSKDKDFKTFAKNRRGTFVGKDPALASMYAKENDSMGYNWEGSKLIPKNTAPQVKPLYVNIQSPFMVEGEDAVAYMYAKSYAKAQRDLMDKAKALGHDAVIYPDGGIAVADPKQIKSSITGD